MRRVMPFAALLACALLTLGGPQPTTTARAPAQAPLAIVAGPYLQAPSDTSMTVMWITERHATGWVEWGEGDSLGNRARTARDGLFDADTRVHRVTVTGLRPGTRYRYRVVAREIVTFEPYKVTYGAETASVPREFTTLSPARRRFTFVVLNDVHENVVLLRQLLSRVTGPFDLLFLDGDMLSHLESEEQIVRRLLAPLSEELARTPFLFVRGNHETRGRFARRLRDYVATPGDRYYYALDHGPVHFTVLDTGEDKADDHWAYSGLVDFDRYRSEQQAWLAREIARPAFTRAAFRVVVSHMPLFGANRPGAETSHGPDDAQAKWAGLLQKGGVDLQISGHTHRRQILPPVAGAHRYPVVIGGGSDPAQATVTVVEVQEARLHVTVIDADGRTVAERAVARRRGSA